MIIELEPYINGRKTTRPAKQPYRGNIALFDELSKLVQLSNTAQQNLNCYEIPKEFYEVEPDLAHFTPKEARVEMFYALKNGFIVPEVPAKCIYYIRKAYNLYKIPNLIFKLIPETEYRIFFQENYLADGLTIRDVVCNFCREDYVPMSTDTLVTAMGNYKEIYIRATDMVAVIPREIADRLSYEDVLSLTVDDYGIKLGDSYIKFMSGYNGACESIYDLRNLV